MPIGLNLANKKAAPKPGNALGQKRKKNIFDDDSGDEDQHNDNGTTEVSTIGGLEQSAPKPKPPSSTGPPLKRKMQLGSGPKPSIKPLSKNSLFADDEDEDEEKEKQKGQMNLGLNQAKPKQVSGAGNEYTNLSALHSSKKHAKEAEELDPSIYSYDAVYESLHSKPSKAATETKSDVPKYMKNLLESAEIRKRVQLRARDRQLAKEREAEGDEFADKEKFVTSAYKAQQEEMRKVEEEEARREKEEEERRKKSGNSGMIGFYRDVLSRGEERHEEVVKASEEAARRVKAGAVEEETAKQPDEKTDTQRAEDLNSRGAHIVVNDEGQVVDKRQLLSAGLNVAPKPKVHSSAPKAAPRPSARPGAAGPQSGRAAQRARQTDMVASQLEERARQEEEAEAAKQREVAEKSRSRKTEGEVSSAKERFLARKREREEAAAKEKAKGA
ncbi:uncharacterized protein N7511_002634 [Penicillium nucicola]|uniref:uncharacterized protein n=1 Tax=Penicillium nucicola TaxID=1850975 RepID=UPI0025452AE1|nr:uncharacterized protein N7511_002634 [Penicillium nucicola]KAJ5770583.1 hypothetical protein N7511_002634 [Penicillium nucicola]